MERWLRSLFKGVRTFTLTLKGNGVTEFAMKEVFSGAMLPMIRGSLPTSARPSRPSPAT